MDFWPPEWCDHKFCFKPPSLWYVYAVCCVLSVPSETMSSFSLAAHTALPSWGLSSSRRCHGSLTPAGGTSHLLGTVLPPPIFGQTVHTPWYVCPPLGFLPKSHPIFQALVQMCLISSAVLIRPLFGGGAVQGDLNVSEIVLPQSKRTQGTHRAGAFSTDLTGLNSYPPTSPRELSGISLRARSRAETCLCPPCLAHQLVEELLVA